MLTAKSEDMDKILGLEYGADDYITKPFNILEVKARIKAIMRRTARKEESAQTAKILVKGNMRIDCESRRVFIGEREINLTAKEYDVLELLAMNPNKVYSRENLLDLVWGCGLSGGCQNSGCTYQKASGEDRAESERAEVCTHKMGGRLLFPGINYISE